MTGGGCNIDSNGSSDNVFVIETQAEESELYSYLRCFFDHNDILQGRTTL